jgi:hypothetical protein
MRQEDMPTPETDAWVAKWDLWNSQNNWPDGLAGPISDVSHAKRLERRLGLAVAVATMEAYAVCAEICQEESTDNGTAQKIEARIRALKEGK